MERCSHIVLSGRCQKCGTPVRGADVNAPGYSANPGQTGIRRRNNAIKNFQTAEGNSPLYQNSRRILVDEFGYTDAELIRLRNRTQAAAGDLGGPPQQVSDDMFGSGETYQIMEIGGDAMAFSGWQIFLNSDWSAAYRDGQLWKSVVISGERATNEDELIQLMHEVVDAHAAEIAEL